MCTGVVVVLTMLKFSTSPNRLGFILIIRASAIIRVASGTKSFTKK